MIRAIVKCIIIFIVTYLGIRYLNLGTYTGVGPIIIFAIVLMIINLIIRPIIQIVSLPVTLLTFGIFAFVINVLMVLLASALVPGITIHGFFSALIISLGIAILTSLVHIGDDQ